MPNKCCVYGCKTNYASEEKKEMNENVVSQSDIKISVFKFPSEKDEQQERERWINVINKINKDFKLDKKYCNL